MAAPAMQAIANITLSANASGVTFANIPQNYRDLVLVISVMHNSTNDKQSHLYPNGDSGNISLVYMDGSGSSAVSGTATTNSLYYAAPGTSTSTIITSTMQIFDYTQTDKHKTFLVRAGSSYNPVSAYASRWASTAAITSLQFYISGTSGDYLPGSTFTLYGVLA
jgi:hypothetical protein